MPKRSKHPGVYLSKRQRRDGPTWYARWRDPISGQEAHENLTSLGLTNAKQREAWAITAARRLQEQRAALSAGGNPLREGVREAGERYLKSKAHLRKDTLRSYREAVRGFATWAESVGIESVQDLDRVALFRFRGSLVACETKGPRTVNSHLARVRPAWRFWRRAGVLPRVTPEDVEDVCEQLKAPRPEPRPLLPGELAQLVDAAEPDELEVVAYYLLTGLRASEGRSLPWSGVRADAITVGTWSKTGVGRVIELDVTPTLGPLLERWRERAQGDLVLGDRHTEWTLRGLRERLAERSGVDWTFQRLRQTCASTLTNAPGIYGGASAARSAGRLGHSTDVAERYYLGRANPPREARTLEAALGIEEALVAKLGLITSTAEGVS